MRGRELEPACNLFSERLNPRASKLERQNVPNAAPFLLTFPTYNENGRYEGERGHILEVQLSPLGTFFRPTPPGRVPTRNRRNGLTEKNVGVQRSKFWNEMYQFEMWTQGAYRNSRNQLDEPRII